MECPSITKICPSVLQEVSGGVKYDEGKRRLSLLPTEPLEMVVKVLEFGAKKYNDYNWRGGMSWCRLIDAALRHIFKWIRNEECDEESGLPHLAHAACCLLFLIQYKKDHPLLDDRYKEKEGYDIVYNGK